MAWGIFKKAWRSAKNAVEDTIEFTKEKVKDAIKVAEKVAGKVGKFIYEKGLKPLDKATKVFTKPLVDKVFKPIYNVVLQPAIKFVGKSIKFGITLTDDAIRVARMTLRKIPLIGKPLDALAVFACNKIPLPAFGGSNLAEVFNIVKCRARHAITMLEILAGDSKKQVSTQLLMAVEELQKVPAISSAHILDPSDIKKKYDLVMHCDENAKKVLNHKLKKAGKSLIK